MAARPRSQPSGVDSGPGERGSEEVRGPPNPTHIYVYICIYIYVCTYIYIYYLIAVQTSATYMVGAIIPARPPTKDSTSTDVSETKIMVNS